MPEHPDLQDEQEYLNRAYDGLEFMRGEARQMLQGVLDLGRGGTFQSRTERDIVVRTSLARLEQLDIGDQALYFGRIDRLPEPADASDSNGNSHRESGTPLLGESFHIGRLAVSGPDHEPLVVDWRAPVAEPFYRATGLDPQGLARRRHLAVRGRTVLGLEDEYFVSPDGSGPASRAGAAVTSETGSAPADEGERLLTEGLVLGGPGALLSALGQARTGHMGDIVGTIQREQDEIIRSPLGGVLVVQGGPGTGKTAVALHRAAYLLYTHRFPLERQGVLVVGPNPLFLRYIEQVLPSLGETGVSLSTVAGLVPEVRVRGVDDQAAAMLKGDVRMVKVLARAVRTRQRPLRRDVDVPFGAGVLRLRVQTTEDVVAMAKRRPGTHNARRRFVEAQVVRALADEYRARLARSGAQPDDEAPPSPEEQNDLAQRLRRVPEVTEALDRMWPRLSAHEFLHDLFGARPLLAAAGKGILTPAEVQRLYRPRSASLDGVAWTVGDTALIDEVRTLLGPRRSRPTRARAQRTEEGAVPEAGFWPQGLAASPLPSGTALNGSEDEVRSFGHIVVDEVQDLSPMQLRMLSRRSLSGSMTVVGDIAQATGPWAPAGWEDITRHLSPQREPRLVELTVSYRTPAEVVALASRVLAVAAPGISPPRPVRQSGYPPRLVPATRRGLSGTVVQLAHEEVAAVFPGRVAVLGPSVMLPELTRALNEAGLDPVDPRDPAGDGLAAGLVVLPADETNGLEFDSVIVVEPSLVAAVGDDAAGEGPPVATTRGLRTLYVAFTRPTKRLAIVHTEPLPVDLA